MSANDAVLKGLSGLYGVLSNPVRLKILGLLRNQEIDVSGLQKELHIGQSGVSQHLHALKVHGLVVERRDGKHVYYRLKNPDILKVMAGTMQFMALDMVADTEVLSNLTEILSIWGGAI